MRSRRVLLVAGVLLLVLAVVLAPQQETEGGGSAMRALGASMGGLRIAFVDLLFLRAERLLREGRVDEVPPLYEAIRELDPENAAAADHLAAVYAFDLQGEAPDAAGRYYWWKRAWDLLEEARVYHPDDPSLLVRTTDLLLEIAPREPGLERRVAAFLPDHRWIGFDRLVTAARLTPTLPRRGRIHLWRLAVLVPLEAATRLRDGDDAERVLALGEETLALRREILAEMRLPVSEADKRWVEGGVPLDEVLEEGIRVVRAVSAARGQDDPVAGREALRRYRDRVPETGLEEVLAQLVPEPD